MPDANIRWALCVIHAFAAWIFGVYIWDWWKNRRRKRSGASGDSNMCDDVDAAEEADEQTTSADAREP
jgi:hypothetical protein